MLRHDWYLDGITMTPVFEKNVVNVWKLKQYCDEEACYEWGGSIAIRSGDDFVSGIWALG